MEDYSLLVSLHLLLELKDLKQVIVRLKNKEEAYKLLSFFFTLFTVLYMKGRYIIMKNLKKTFKDVKYNEMDVLLRVGVFAAGVLTPLITLKVINNMIKK